MSAARLEAPAERWRVAELFAAPRQVRGRETRHANGLTLNACDAAATACDTWRAALNTGASLSDSTRANAALRYTVATMCPV
jgi:hypothetical protein